MIKSIDIINFINEDKFSKYTIEQIYDELGDEDFIEYLERVCNKTISRLGTKNKFKSTIFNMTGILVYINTSNGFDEKFTFSHGRSNKVIEIAYTVSGQEVNNRARGLVVTSKKIPVLTQEIIELYNETGSKIAREKLSKK